MTTFLKNALLFLILWGATGAASHGAAPHGSNALVTLAGAFFVLPFFFLSGLGGELADRLDKAYLAQRIKLAELAAAVIAVVGFLLQSVPILFVALFTFGTLSALFGPVKYGILPDHLPKEELPQANALVEGATFMAIIGGTVVGRPRGDLPRRPLPAGRGGHGLRGVAAGWPPGSFRPRARPRPISAFSATSSPPPSG